MFVLENRYQDSGWESLDERFHNLQMAKDCAYKLSKDAIAYGMIRIVDFNTGEVMVTYPAGSGGEIMNEDQGIII